jgi:predicted lactoylglutathione lyase
MRSIFVNLPVRDLDRSKRFFSALGFTFNPQFTDETAACMVVEENIFVMLLTEARFGDFVTGPIADANKATEVLLALSAESRAEVAEAKRRALEAGARAWKPDQDYGFMVGCSFQDPDGHVWEVIWMDPAHVQAGAEAQAASAL